MTTTEPTETVLDYALGHTAHGYLTHLIDNSGDTDRVALCGQLVEIGGSGYTAIDPVHATCMRCRNRLPASARMATQIAADINTYIGTQWDGEELYYDRVTGEANGALGGGSGIGPARWNVKLVVPRGYRAPYTAEEVLDADREQQGNLDREDAYVEREVKDATRRIVVAEADLAAAEKGGREYAHAEQSLECAREALARATDPSLAG